MENTRTIAQVIAEIEATLARCEAMVSELAGKGGQAESKAEGQACACPAPATIADPVLGLAALWAEKMGEAFEKDALAARQRFAPEYLQEIEAGWYFRNWEIDESVKSWSAKARRRAMLWVMEDAENALASLPSEESEESDFKRCMALMRGWHYVCETKRALASLCAAA